jgi:pimeloyl-ACP methyl ester carboxylesterase
MSHRPAFVTVDTGVRLEYVEQGARDGTPVVLLHGVTDSWRSFEPMLRHLPPSIHAFAISQRGHGDSARPESGYVDAAMAQDVRAFMDAVGLSRAIVAGHSMGAMVAQRFAVDAPERLRALVLMASFSTLYHRPLIADFVRSAVEPLADPIDPAFAREWQMSSVGRPVDPAFLDTVVGETLKVPSRVWRAAFAGLLETPACLKQLATVSVPTLLLWGDRDGYADRHDQDALLAAIPGSRLIAYAAGGHAIHWEDPERVAVDLTAFVQGV